MGNLSNIKNDSRLGGFNSFDDCGTYKINEKQSIIQSLDFFTPIVDDPYLFGQIAAANSLSDIYAMGGTPLFALNITAFPSEKISLNILSKILQGGIDKCNSVHVSILGGHSIKDDVPKYGLAVTGLIDNDKIIKNNTAKKGDDIILTKPIGSGILSTAIKKRLASKDTIDKVIYTMNTLNDKTSKIMTKYNVSACTDVTGFGLLGHLNEMCKGSNLSAKISYKKVPLICDTEKFAEDDIIPGGTKNNLKFLNKSLFFSKGIKQFQQLILADAQTSGGLLISCQKSKSEKMLSELNKKAEFDSIIIGEFRDKEKYSIYCEE